MSPNRTQDGFISRADGTIETGLVTTATVTSQKKLSNKDIYDVIVIGAGFAGLIAARELSHRGQSVLLVEARDRIGGRTFSTQVDNQTYEMGGTWIHWSQPHVWTEVIRYGLSIIETKGAIPDRIHASFDNGSRLKILPMNELWPKICDTMNKYSDVDGVQGRTVFPQPHTPLVAFETMQKYDQLSMQDRLDQISDLLGETDEMRQIMEAYLCMNPECSLAESGFADHLRWWALGDFESERLFDKTSRYKIREGSSALAQAILSDCREVDLLFSTPIIAVDRTVDNNNVIIRTQTGQSFTSRAVIITVPLNVLRNIEFHPPLENEKQRVINEGQCRGGTKFSIKLEKPVGCWYGLAASPSPFHMGFNDDEAGSIVIGFGTDDALDIRDINTVQQELSKFLPDGKIKCIVAHDWRNDSFAGGTWSWFRPGQMSSSLSILQKHEPPVFFASSDISNGWRGFIDGALGSGLSTARQVLIYLNNQSTYTSTIA